MSAFTDSQSLQTQIEHNDLLTEERAEGIEQIGREVLEINEIMTDMSFLVEQQGPIMDTIFDNVVTTSGHVQQGTKEVNKSDGHQKTSRKRLFCLMISLFITITVLVTIVSHTG